MKIIIAGDGKVGSTLTRQLSSAGYDLTLIDQKKSVLDSSLERYDILAIQGNCALKSVLQQAGVKEADLLIAATSADEINLLCCTTAHDMNPELHTIARIRNPEYTDQIYDMREIFGLSMPFNPERQAASEMEQLLKYPGFLKRDTFAKGKVEIVELRVDKNSKLCNVALNDLDGIVKCRVLVCAVLRGKYAMAPDGNFVLLEGDRIFVTALKENLTVLLKNLGIITHRVKKVILCGGGRISYYLAQMLEKQKIEVKLIESDYDRCMELAERLPNTSIIHGDASNQELLESEGISECDALISATGMDELNMIISLFSYSCKVPQVITKLGHIKNRYVLDTLPLGSVICPKDLCCATIVRYVRAMYNQTGAAVSVHSIADGQLEAMEFQVDDTVQNCGVPLKNLKLKRNVLLACINHGARTEIPNGDSCYVPGDIVIVVTNGDDVIYQMNDIFER